MNLFGLTRYASRFIIVNSQPCVRVDLLLTYNGLASDATVSTKGHVLKQVGTVLRRVLCREGKPERRALQKGGDLLLLLVASAVQVVVQALSREIRDLGHSDREPTASVEAQEKVCASVKNDNFQGRVNGENGAKSRLVEKSHSLCRAAGSSISTVQWAGQDHQLCQVLSPFTKPVQPMLAWDSCYRREPLRVGGCPASKQVAAVLHSTRSRMTRCKEADPQRCASQVTDSRSCEACHSRA